MRNALVLILVTALSCVCYAENQYLTHKPETSGRYCTPSQSCWPSDLEWSNFASVLTGKLSKPKFPIAACFHQPDSEACLRQIKMIQNPFFLQSDPGALESQGYLDAWHGHASAYAVEAANSKDIAAAVNFAREHNIKLVIKGAGHDYLGRSSAPNSLLIWTHNMRDMTYHKAFVPSGCGKDVKPTEAITAGAGTRWMDLYHNVTTEHNRYAQGGGCTTVGVAGGFIQGGGFGSFSNKYGLAAASVIEAEVITADGSSITVNQCQHPDMYWAIRGGGGGTFGVVSNITVQLHKLPKYFGIVEGKITAKDDQAFKKLIKKLLTFYHDSLNNEHWGEQISIKPDNTVDIFMITQGLSKQQEIAVWQPMRQWVKANKNLFAMTFDAMQIPARKMWDHEYWSKVKPNFVTKNPMKGVAESEFWLAPTRGEVFKYWYSYHSRWIPESLFTSKKVDTLTDAFFRASRYYKVTLHVNKGIAGSSKEAIERSKQTSINPVAFKASALVILASGSNRVFPGVKGKEPNYVEARQSAANVKEAMNIITAVTPGSGSYANEADYFEQNWQHEFWGDSYKRLLKIKHKYDPGNLFTCHHCVGSE